MSQVKIIALGNPDAGDDGAAMRACRELDARVVHAGRPGPGLIDLWDGRAAVVLVDVVRSGAEPGSIVTIPLADLPAAAIARSGASSHGFGPAHAIQLAVALGRPLPNGWFVGIEGANFAPGQDLSPAVATRLPQLTQAVRQTLARLG